MSHGSRECATKVPAFTSQQLAERTLHRRAAKAAIWGIPIVNTT